MNSIGKLIKQARLQKGLTLEQVGKAVGVGKSTVLKWESGAISNMKRDKIAALAQILDISPAVIMGWNDEPQHDNHASSYDNTFPITLTSHETKVIIAYRDKPEMQPAVDTLLGIASDEEEYIPVAARNGKSGMVKVTSSPEERKAALDKELPGVSTPKTPDVF